MKEIKKYGFSIAEIEQLKKDGFFSGVFK